MCGGLVVVGEALEEGVVCGRKVGVGVEEVSGGEEGERALCCGAIRVVSRAGWPAKASSLGFVGGHGVVVAGGECRA